MSIPKSLHFVKNLFLVTTGSSCLKSVHILRSFTRSLWLIMFSSEISYGTSLIVFNQKVELFKKMYDLTG